MNYFVLAIIWIIWCTVHSALISITLTNFLKRRLGSNFRFYRFFYNLVAITTLIPVGLYTYFMQSEPLFRWEGYWRICQFFLITAAVFLFVAGARHYNLLQTLGIHQIRKGSTHSVLTESGEVDTTGILGLSRHPWYAGVIGLIWARQLDTSALIVNLILTAYLIIGTILEERKLLIEFGDKYLIYQKNVSIFIPIKWLMSKIGK